MQCQTVWCSYCGVWLPEGVTRFEHLEDIHPVDAAKEAQERAERRLTKQRVRTEQNAGPARRELRLAHR